MALPPIFDEAIERIFSRWTVLSLAVEGGWGGRESRAKRAVLKDEVLDQLALGGRRKRPPSHENPGDVEDLADFMYRRLDELFNVDTDDRSDEEVAAMCLRLYNTCRTGDLSFAQHVLQTVAPGDSSNVAQSKGIDNIQYATDEDKLLDQMDMMDLGGLREEDEDGSSSGEDDPGGEEGGMPGAGDVASMAASSGGLPAAASVATPARPPPPAPVVDEDGFTSVVRGGRRRAPPPQ